MISFISQSKKQKESDILDNGNKWGFSFSGHVSVIISQ